MVFEDYVAQQRRALLRFATVLTGRPWLADDIVSDVLGRAFERWDRIGTLDQPHAYVRRMVVNEYLTGHRRLARAAPHDDVEGLQEHLPDRVAADPADGHAERDAMIQRLERLPRRQRTAVVLRYYADLPDDEIADHLGCRRSTVRSQVARALNTLRIDLAAVPVPALPKE